MDSYRYVQALVLQLLDESPLTSQDVITDVRHLKAVGEEALALDTMPGHNPTSDAEDPAYRSERLARSMADSTAAIRSASRPRAPTARPIASSESPPSARSRR